MSCATPGFGTNGKCGNFVDITEHPMKRISARFRATPHLACKDFVA